MTLNELITEHNRLSADAVALIAKKSADYTGATGDTFANFRAAEFIGVKAELSVLIRMMDKISRLASFSAKGLLQTDSLKDSIIDIINYAVIYYCMQKEKQCENLQQP